MHFRSRAAVLAPRDDLEIPNVFPASIDRRSMTGYHDILRGHVPITNLSPSHGWGNEIEDREGWIRILMPSDEAEAYTDPSLRDWEQSNIFYGRHTAENISLDVMSSYLVERKRLDLNRALRMPEVDEIGFKHWPGVEIPLGENALTHYSKRIESAIVFAGRTVIDNVELGIAGVHFRSGRIRGWAKFTS